MPMLPTSTSKVCGRETKWAVRTSMWAKRTRTPGYSAAAAVATCSRQVCTRGPARHASSRIHRQHVPLLHPMASANCW